MWIFLENINRYLNQFASELVILVAFEMQLVCNQFIHSSSGWAISKLS
jgi:uncharacterized ion transporter superfamily protein YfcC